MERLGAFCDKVLRLIVYVRDHGALGVESPCNELYVCSKDRVDRRRAIVGRPKILVEFTGAGLVLCIAAHEGLVGHERERGASWRLSGAAADVDVDVHLRPCACKFGCGGERLGGRDR
jgi:hypothetical protein